MRAREIVRRVAQGLERGEKSLSDRLGSSSSRGLPRRDVGAARDDCDGTGEQRDGEEQKNDAPHDLRLTLARCPGNGLRRAAA